MQESGLLQRRPMRQVKLEALIRFGREMRIRIGAELLSLINDEIAMGAKSPLCAALGHALHIEGDQTVYSAWVSRSRYSSAVAMRGPVL